MTVNKDWIEPELNKDYAEWAEHNGTVILPAKVRRPKFKSSVENSVGILEKGFFHDLEERQYFSLEQFNTDLWEKLDELNEQNLKNRDYSRYDRWQEEKGELMPLPSTFYHYMERKEAKVSSDFHVRFDNAYYSVPRQYVHKRVLIKATATLIQISALSGDLLCEWPRAKYKGQWLTNPEHLPGNSREMAEWNGPYFIQKAMTIGPNTVEVIKHILSSRKYEVQTYRQCVGVLGFAKRYGKKVLEECCRQALGLNKVTYPEDVVALYSNRDFMYMQAALMKAQDTGGTILDGFSMLRMEAGLSELKELREFGAVYFNVAGGHTFNLKYTQFCRRKELIFPSFSEADIRIKKFSQGGSHWYAYIGDVQLKNGEKQKWNSYEAAKEFAYSVLAKC